MRGGNRRGLRPLQAALRRSFPPQAIMVNQALTLDAYLQRFPFTGSTIVWC
jgi:hypothetical protein